MGNRVLYLAVSWSRVWDGIAMVDGNELTLVTEAGL